MSISLLTNEKPLTIFFFFMHLLQTSSLKWQLWQSKLSDIHNNKQAYVCSKRYYIFLAFAFSDFQQAMSILIVIMLRNYYPFNVLIAIAFLSLQRSYLLLFRSIWDARQTRQYQQLSSGYFLQLWWWQPCCNFFISALCSSDIVADYENWLVASDMISRNHW